MSRGGRSRRGWDGGKLAPGVVLAVARVGVLFMEEGAVASRSPVANPPTARLPRLAASDPK